ncbi:helix-turn-helix transcriptional regulator [Rurimicrobium arvi]|uniref:HTH cro/C1-type domain-containing protein n=1 Tax=Rurimicrobium arvi TaxID=2049916 RepID=A0ABP8MYK3_9BACT
MKFDLKKFRMHYGFHKQKDFADKVNYQAPVISRMEKDEQGKPVSDKLLIAIENAFQVNLDQFKRYDRNKLGLYRDNVLPADFFQERITTKQGGGSHKENDNLKQQLIGLLEEKSALDNKYFVLSKQQHQKTVDLALLQEQLSLIRKLTDDSQQILERLLASEKIPL